MLPTPALSYNTILIGLSATEEFGLPRREKLRNNVDAATKCTVTVFFPRLIQGTVVSEMQCSRNSHINYGDAVWQLWLC